MGFSAGTFTYSGSSTTFSAPTTGTTISSTAAAAAFTETAAGLSTCLLKDGTQTATAAIPLAVAPSALTHAARVNELQNGYGTFLTSVSGTNTIVGTATPTPAYTVGQRFTFVPAATNTGATTLNISSLGAGAVQFAGAALAGGELVAGMPVTVYVTAATPVFEIIGSTKPVSGTKQATTSGTSITFTIPAWVKNFKLQFNGVSTDGTDAWLMQLGDAGDVEATGYLAAGANLTEAGAVAVINSTAGFPLNIGSAAAIVSGHVDFALEDASDFTWTCSGVLNLSNAATSLTVSGRKATSAALTRVVLTTTGATNAFDAGEMNVLYW